MTAGRDSGIALLAGAGAGLVALGVGGRVAMAALVLAAGGRPDVTLGGSLEVLAVGTGYGAAGGLLALGLRRPLTAPRMLGRGGALGLGLLAIAWLTSRVGRSAASGLAATRPLAIALAVICFVGYGLLVEGFLHRWVDRGPRGRPR